MNRLKTPQEKQLEQYKKSFDQYKKDSINPMYAFILVGVALILTALIENL